MAALLYNARVPDEPPPMVQNNVEENKKGKKKPSLKEVADDVPPVSTTYEVVHIDERSTSLFLSGSDNMSPFRFFELYFSSQHLDIIARHININAQLKREADTKKRF